MTFRFLSIFNILCGLLAVLACVVLASLGIALSGGLSRRMLWEVSMYVAPLGIAGALSCASGISLWRRLPEVRPRSLLMLGVAWVILMAYCLTTFVSLRATGSFLLADCFHDEEIVMLFTIPSSFLLIIAIELLFLWRGMLRDKRATLSEVAAPTAEEYR
jgi:hypothetical protein